MEVMKYAFLKNIKDAFYKNTELTNRMLDPYFSQKLMKSQKSAVSGFPQPAGRCTDPQTGWVGGVKGNAIQTAHTKPGTARRGNRRGR